jgi:hypothetical protein
MKNWFLGLCIFSTLSSCEDIIGVADISDEIIVILAPANDVVLTINNVNFSWDNLEDAENYRLQIATPNFEAASQILLDTTITATNFNKTLESSAYQWRVRGQNSGFETGYTTQSFIIEE